MKNSVFVIISALQGESSAMNSAIPLILHSVCGRSMLRHALAAAGCLTGNPPLVIFDGDGEALEEHLAEAEISDLISVKYSTLSEWFQVLARHSSGYEYLIQLPANLPLLSAAALEGLLQFTAGNQLDAVIMSEDEDAWTTIKPGHAVLCFRTKWLYDALSIHARQLEAMPPDALNFKGFLETGEAGKAIFHPPHPEELMSVTDRICLAEAEARMRLRINESHMRKGVTFIDPSHTYIGPDVHISRDTIIYPGNVLEGSTVIGSGCILYPGNRLHNALIGDKVSLQSSVVLDSSVGHETTVGPYAYIRPGSRIGSHARNRRFCGNQKIPCWQGKQDISSVLCRRCGNRGKCKYRMRRGLRQLRRKKKTEGNRRRSCLCRLQCKSGSTCGSGISCLCCCRLHHY